MYIYIYVCMYIYIYKYIYNITYKFFSYATLIFNSVSLTQFPH